MSKKILLELSDDMAESIDAFAKLAKLKRVQAIRQILANAMIDFEHKHRVGRFAGRPVRGVAKGER